ncbi:MAG TPA: zf-HC2 domain-containing protein, partial [Patescibacteria group bacterium]|nr:zf-HC2 domain-containing protein [Patescibacteria group bacterium]
MKDADRNSEALDAVLRRAMREAPAAATPECADAESIAAYFDGSIAAAERPRLDAHFADCARCQAQLAA